MVVEIHNLSDIDISNIVRIYDLDYRIENYVKEIIEDVRIRGDYAVIDYTEKFDGVKLSMNEIEISKERIYKALSIVPEDYIRTVKEVYDRLLEFHKMQLPKGFKMEISPGVKLEFRWTPLTRVGLYIPGGLHPYPSTILMTSAPAKIAGVREIIACTPPRPKGLNPYILATFAIAGVERVFQIGGIQAIAAMAFGTEIVPKVDKIVGPGGIYIATAKRLLYGIVGLDAPTGPSEIVILTDGSIKAEYVALDLLAQLEHGPGCKAILITLSRNYAMEVARIIEYYATEASIELSKDSLLILVASNLDEALDFIDRYSPEHLEVHLEEQPIDLVERCRSCGTILIGEFSPAAISDYATGGNHILPVGGAGRFSSALSVYDFMKHITIQNISYEGFKRIAEAAVRLADIEGFTMHRRAIEARLREGST
ncbi:MAG: histidinol dehydrogenase [Candidatus Bathyarchaeia archaeon]